MIVFGDKILISGFSKFFQNLHINCCQTFWSKISEFFYHCGKKLFWGHILSDKALLFLFSSFLFTNKIDIEKKSEKPKLGFDNFRDQEVEENLHTLSMRPSPDWLNFKDSYWLRELYKGSTEMPSLLSNPTFGCVCGTVWREKGDYILHGIFLIYYFFFFYNSFWSCCAINAKALIFQNLIMYLSFDLDLKSNL